MSVCPDDTEATKTAEKVALYAAKQKMPCKTTLDSTVCSARRTAVFHECAAKETARCREPNVDVSLSPKSEREREQKKKELHISVLLNFCFQPLETNKKYVVWDVRLVVLSTYATPFLQTLG